MKEPSKKTKPNGRQSREKAEAGPHVLRVAPQRGRAARARRVDAPDANRRVPGPSLAVHTWDLSNSFPFKILCTKMNLNCEAKGPARER